MAICPTCQCAVDDSASECPIDGTPLQTAQKLVGKVLGDRYRIIKKLGEGGMGTVFLAEHVVLGKQLAVKILRDELSRDEELVKRFQQEAVAASHIGQENIVNVTDFGRSPDGALYFVMEFLAGQSLSELVRRESYLKPERALPIMAQICRALAAAHSRGIIHRDLKPDNVIVTPRDDGSDFVKVLDFGISKVASGPEGGRLTRVGMLMGTPEYMAPEQVEAASVDHRTDIYSFGALAYELVTGTLPFRANTPVALLMKHQSEMPEPPTKRRPDLPIPASLESCILRALSKKPDERQQTMTDVLNELSACMASLGLGPVFTPPPGALRSFTVTPRPVPTNPPAPSPSSAEYAAPKRGGTMALGSDELTGSDKPTAMARTPMPLTSPPLEGAALEAHAIQRGPGKGVVLGILAALLLVGGGGAVLMMSGDKEAPPPVTAVQPPPEAPKAVEAPKPPEPVKTVAAPEPPKPAETAVKPVKAKAKKKKSGAVASEDDDNPYGKVEDLKEVNFD